MDVEIVKQNGQKFRLSDYGIVQDFVVHSIDRSVVRDPIDGRSGLQDYGVEIGDRTIEVPMIFKAVDLHDYAHLRDELYGILDDREPFYIREMRRPKSLQYDFADFGQKPKWKSQTDNEYVNGKQYRVRLNGSVSPEQRGLSGEVSLEFVTSGLPYAESAYTTLELHDSGFAHSAEKYGLVDNIDDEKVKYRFTENTFTVYNAGNVTVEPESMLLHIFIANVTGNSITIKNNTTDETFTLNRSMNARHIQVNGMIVTDGTTPVFKDTNKRFISLVPGDNDITVSGAAFTEVRFSFKFLYK